MTLQSTKSIHREAYLNEPENRGGTQSKPKGQSASMALFRCCEQSVVLPSVFANTSYRHAGWQALSPQPAVTALRIESSPMSSTFLAHNEDPS